MINHTSTEGHHTKGQTYSRSVPVDDTIKTVKDISSRWTILFTIFVSQLARARLDPKVWQSSSLIPPFIPALCPPQAFTCRCGMVVRTESELCWCRYWINKRLEGCCFKQTFWPQSRDCVLFVRNVRLLVSFRTAHCTQNNLLMH